jgi:hypothetical protein
LIQTADCCREPASNQLDRGQVAARRILEEFFTRRLDDGHMRQQLYYAAFVERDQHTLQKQLDWAAAA